MAEGIFLMAAGMGTVAFFLALLVLVMEGTGRFFQRFERLFEQQPASTAPPRHAEAEEKMLVAAAIAAITAHRNR